MGPSDTSSGFALTFESFTTLLGVAVSDLQIGAGTQPTAQLRVPTSVLEQVVLDWHADVELLLVEDGIANVLMRGTVSNVEAINEATVALDVRVRPDLLEDVGVPGIVVEEATRADVAWSVLMTSGLEPDSLSVEGKAELPTEEFRVVVPIYGMVVEQPITLDRVQLLPSPHEPPVEVSPEFSHLAEPFRTCSGIAVVEVLGQTLFEAEQRGLAEIDHALGAALLLQRIAATDRRPASSGYSRELAGAILGRHAVVAVLGRWGRRWLRQTQEVRPPGEDPPLLEVGAYRLPAFFDVPQPLRQAIASWRRAVEEVDRVTRSLALWESLEFYAAGTKLPRRFSRSEISRLRERVSVDLAPIQLERVDQVIHLLNSPPLVAKLEQAAADDGVVLSLGNTEVLQRLRQARNEIVHGRKWHVPTHSDLRKGLGVATRLLLARLELVPTNTGPNSSDPPRASGEVPDRASPEGPKAAGRSPSATFTQNDKRRAEQATEAAMLMLPYLESGELVPLPVASQVREVWGDATEDDLLAGTMRACDVAVKHLAKPESTVRIRSSGA